MLVVMFNIFIGIKDFIKLFIGIRILLNYKIL